MNEQPPRPAPAMTRERIDALQKRASMFGCALYLVAFAVLVGILLYHLIRG